MKLLLHFRRGLIAVILAVGSVVSTADAAPVRIAYSAISGAMSALWVAQEGGYFKREGRPSEKEILTSRLCDRPLRPLFPKGFHNEIQVINLVISADNQNDPDVLAMVGSSAAVALSGIPFEGPFGAVRVARVGGTLVANPTYAQIAAATLELVVAGSEDAILMVEAGAQEATEEQMLEAIAFGHERCRELVRIQRALGEQAAQPRWPFAGPAPLDPELVLRIGAIAIVCSLG